MDIEKLIHCLQCCARVDAHNGGCDDCGLEYCGPECQQLCGTAATALSTLQAENAEMQKQLNEFSEFLCRMTGNLLSKTNYTAQAMIEAAEDYQQRVCDNYCDLRADLARVTAERDAAVSDLETIMAYKSDTCQFCKNGQCYVRGGTKSCLPKWRGQKEE